MITSLVMSDKPVRKVVFALVITTALIGAGSSASMAATDSTATPITTSGNDELAAGGTDLAPQAPCIIDEDGDPYCICDEFGPLCK